MWAQWAQTRTRCADGPVKARNGPAGMKWEGRTLGKTASEAGLKPGYCRETPPVTTRKTLAVLVQSFPKGDVRFSVVLSVVFKTPEMHIPPWYRFRSEASKSRCSLRVLGMHPVK